MYHSFCMLMHHHHHHWFIDLCIPYFSTRRFCNLNSNRICPRPKPAPHPADKGRDFAALRGYLAVGRLLEYLLYEYAVKPTQLFFLFLFFVFLFLILLGGGGQGRCFCFNFSLSTILLRLTDYAMSPRNNNTRSRREGLSLFYSLSKIPDSGHFAIQYPMDFNI